MRKEAVVRWVRGPAVVGAPVRLSRGAWAVDASIALLLAVGTVVGDLNRSYVEVRPEFDTTGVPVRLPLPAPAPVDGVAPVPPPPVPPPPVPPLPELPGIPTGGDPPHAVSAFQHTLPPVEPWELMVAVLTALPLVLRRRCPLAVYWAVMGATVLLHQGRVAADATTVTFASGLIAAYSAAVYSPHRKAVVASLLAGVGLYAVFPLVPDVDQGLVPLLVLLPVALAAHGVHTWRQRMRVLREEQQAALRRAVEQERSRIARELHDVVTHNVSMMTIQAGAARKVLDTAPDLAREAMLAVESAGRSAMSELRHVMGLLTMAAADGPAATADDPATDVDLAPQPGLDRLEELADRVRGTGVPVEVAVRGTPTVLPAGVDLTAYRVAQEALTNAVKHAAGASVSVTVEYAPGELRVEVTDTGGQPRPSAAPGSGRGLLGLRERLAIYGGTLQAGGRPRGGYRVRAVLPVEEL
ncbi:sensor histidine kinase [Streptomyces lateritius]|uniref:histidine kinase n=1 Tax=Streptomyces lateritius TaxID=67313 RepID=A0ABW6YN07_9ACTN